MKLPRRKFLHLAAGAAAVPVASRAAFALNYPTRPVRLVVGFPAGLAPDVIARLVSQPLSERLGQPIVIENRPGAGNNIGTEIVVKAEPDGYTLLLIVVATSAANAAIYPNLGFNFIRDIAPVASIGDSLFVMVVTPSLPVKTIAEFIAYAKANPGKINMVSPGSGTAPHLFGELFKMMAGVDLVHVPYRSSFVADLLDGRVQVSFATVTTAIGYIRTGKLRALAVTGATRLEALPDVPTLAEFVPGYEASGSLGIGAPRDTPKDIIEKLDVEINAVIAEPNMKARLLDLGVLSMRMTPTEFGKLIVDETEKWAKVVKFAGIKLE